ncbi:MAG TPA: response regulator [Oligoflexia bacterium]|nr:response regulator [Oligoflexia bacterium]HMP48406.1 response regulator [Oligoflexia bacterium]
MKYPKSSFPILIFDSNLCIEEVSDAAIDLLGFDRSGLLGVQISSLIVDEQSSPLSTDLLSQNSSQVALTIPSEIFLSVKNIKSRINTYNYNLSSEKASRSYSALILPVLSGKNTNNELKTDSSPKFIAILSSKHESGFSSNEDKKLNNQVEASPPSPLSETEIQRSKLEALGTLAGSIAHDLNNLLMAVLGHLSYLRLSKAVSNEESLLAAEEGARTAAKLSQQILDFARHQDAANEWLDLNEVVQRVLPLVIPSLPNSVQIACSGSVMPLPVLIDESQITQIVLNLVLNARDAMPYGGQIQVELDSMHLSSEAMINGCLLVEGLYARIQVSDTGHGMNPEIKTRIFEPFFTTKRGTGTGLGLATVFFLVKSLSGAIRVDSEVDAGTVFTVLLPLADSKGKAKADYHLAHKNLEEVRALSHSSGEGQSAGVQNGSDIHPDQARIVDKQYSPSGKILVVDDEDSVRMVLQRSLELLGYEVVVAVDGREALKIFSQISNSVSLVVMDMIMPNIAGHELFYKLREISPDVKVLISSGYASDSKTQDLLKNGAAGFIQKPFAIEELASEVRRCFPGGE